jgi:hypothetical protein
MADKPPLRAGDREVLLLFAWGRLTYAEIGPGARSLPSASSERQRLIDADEVPWVIACLDPSQPVRVRPVVGIRPAIQIRVGEILELSWKEVSGGGAGDLPAGPSQLMQGRVTTP